MAPRFIIRAAKIQRKPSNLLKGNAKSCFLKTYLKLDVNTCEGKIDPNINIVLAFSDLSVFLCVCVCESGNLL